MTARKTGATGAEDAARTLTAALDRMSGKLDEVRQGSEERDEALAEYGRRNRRLILGTIASVILDVVLTVTLSIVAVQAHNASIAARHASASNLALCQAGNVARHQQVELWDFLLSLNSGHKQTTQQKRNVAKFRAHLAVIFAPRNCAALAKKASE